MENRFRSYVFCQIMKKLLTFAFCFRWYTISKRKIDERKSTMKIEILFSGKITNRKWKIEIHLFSNFVGKRKAMECTHSRIHSRHVSRLIYLGEIDQIYNKPIRTFDLKNCDGWSFAVNEQERVNSKFFNNGITTSILAGKVRLKRDTRLKRRVIRGSTGLGFSSNNSLFTRKHNRNVIKKALQVWLIIYDL